MPLHLDGSKDQHLSEQASGLGREMQVGEGDGVTDPQPDNFGEHLNLSLVAVDVLHGACASQPLLLVLRLASGSRLAEGFTVISHEGAPPA